MIRFNELDQARGICKCGVHLETLLEMLREGYDSDNWQYAVKIIKNCKECAKAVRKNLNWLCENIP